MANANEGQIFLQKYALKTEALSYAHIHFFWKASQPSIHLTNYKSEFNKQKRWMIQKQNWKKIDYFQARERNFYEFWLLSFCFSSSYDSLSRFFHNQRFEFLTLSNEEKVDEWVQENPKDVYCISWLRFSKVQYSGVPNKRDARLSIQSIFFLPTHPY